MIKAPAIPQLSSQVPAEVRRAFDSIRNYYASLAKAGGAVAVSDLQIAGLADSSGNIIASEAATVPPQLVNFTAHGAFATIMLSWNDPGYKFFSHVEIWRSDVDNLGTAVLIGTTDSTMYVDIPPNASTSVTYYYWARVVGSPTIYGPFNAIAGTAASTADDPTYALEVLTNQIREGQLYHDLNARIDLIDSPGNGLTEILSDLADNQLEFISRQYNEQFLGLMREKNISDATVYIDPATGQISLKATANITTDIEARLSLAEFNIDAQMGQIESTTAELIIHDQDIASINTSITQMQGQIDLKVDSSYVDEAMLALPGALTPEQQNLMDGLGPEATMQMVLMANKMNLESLMHKANIAQAQLDIKSNADAISAEASARLLLAATVSENAALLVSEQTTRATADATETSARLALAAQTASDIAAAVLAEQTARTNADSAEASARLILAGRMDTAESNISQINTISSSSTSANARALAAVQTAISDPTTGLSSKASVTALQTANSTLLSAVAQAIMQTSTTLNGQTTTVETMSGTLNGVTGEHTVKIDANGVVAGVGLINGPLGSEFGVRAGKFFVVDPAAPTTQLIPFIVSGGKTIMDTALIGNATIKNAMIETVSADKLFVASGTIAEAVIGTGHITNAMIGDTIQSTNFIPGTSGWKISKSTNSAEFYGIKAVFGAGSSGYGNLSDRPTSLAGISATDASTLSTANANALAAQTAISSWTRPGQTLIDGNKIYTGDAYVDTLQIKNGAVTIPRVYRGPIVRTSIPSGTSLLASIPFPVDQFLVGKPIFVTLSGTLWNLYGIFADPNDGLGGVYTIQYLLKNSGVVEDSWGVIRSCNSTMLLWPDYSNDQVTDLSASFSVTPTNSSTATNHVIEIYIQCAGGQHTDVVACAIGAKK